jgi:hypothetical protein
MYTFYMTKSALFDFILPLLGETTDMSVAGPRVYYRKESLTNTLTVRCGCHFVKIS